MNFSNQSDKTLIVKGKRNLVQVYIQDISYIIGDSYLCFIHQVNTNKPIIVLILLKHLEEELSEYGFLRINHNIIINPRYIKTIGGKKKRFVTMSNGTELDISRRKWYKFKNSILPLML